MHLFQEGPDMRPMKFLLVALLGLASSVAMAQNNRNCGDLANPQAREECLKHKSGNDVDCSKLDNEQARKECRERKAGSDDKNIDCSKLDNDELRRKCRREKRD